MGAGSSGGAFASGPALAAGAGAATATFSPSVTAKFGVTPLSVDTEAEASVGEFAATFACGVPASPSPARLTAPAEVAATAATAAVASPVRTTVLPSLAASATGQASLVWTRRWSGSMPFNARSPAARAGSRAVRAASPPRATARSPRQR